MNEASSGAALAGQGPTPESLRGALITAVVLALIGATAIAVGGLYLQRGDSGQLYTELFGARELPYGFEWAGGTSMAGDQRWVRLARNPALGEDPSLPESVLMGRYGARRSARRLFERNNALTGKEFSDKIEEWTATPTSSFEGLVAAGTIAFGTKETDFVHLRLYQSDGNWHEVVRIDASVGELGQVLSAHWPNSYADADPEQLLPFLEALDL